MLIREAKVSDIQQMQVVRNAVKENVLTNPLLVQNDDYVAYLNKKGNGWVAEDINTLVGFAIVDAIDNNVWALFILPAYEGKGIGKQLHHTMLEWYFKQTKKTIWLSTAFDTKAETFYRKQGWKEVGKYNEKELKFEMSFLDWQKNKNKKASV